MSILTGHAESADMAAASVLFPVPAHELVTHRPPMLLVSSLLMREETLGRVSATVPDSGPMVHQGRVLDEYLVEILAQSMAVIDGYDSVRDGKPPSGGFLVGLKHFNIHRVPVPGQSLVITLVKLFEFGPMTIMEGRVKSGEALLAEGELKVWIPE